jgi:DNA-3-methyladenine glycosylase II
MFGLGREDVFPVGDLGIRKGIDRLFDAEMTRAEMTDAAERWDPYRSYASLYLWRAVEG